MTASQATESTVAPPSPPTTTDNVDKLRSEALAADSKQLPQGYYSSTRVIGTFGGIGFSLLGTYWAFSVGAAVITAINQDIGPSANSSLFSIVWTTCNCISILLFGRLSDRFGRRGLAISSNLLGIIGGIVAATAPTMNALIGANVLIGLSSGPLASYPLLTGELATNKTKYLATVLVVIPNVIATGFGAYLGQRIMLQTTWRWIFIIYLYHLHGSRDSAILFILLPLIVHLNARQGQEGHRGGEEDRLRWAVSARRWPRTIPPGRVLGRLALGLELCYDPRSPGFRIRVPRCLCAVRNLRRSAISHSSHALLQRYDRLYASLHYFSRDRLPQRGAPDHLALSILKVFGTSDWETAAWLTTTVAFGSWAGIVIFGSFYHVIKRIRWQLVVGCVWMSAFVGAMASIDPTELNQAAAFSFLATLPVGWGEVITMVMVQYVVSDMDLGVAFDKP